ncbi:hypothetical protein [Mamestra configurata nucleopolyhedrovirus B]|uniref:Uncharacterized protein n=1 Tax=Mamestra configurata nucleopolyhedrovirus B TaxID=204440 RepID=Q8JMD5_9ABAC|nr:hypothetical protein McnBVgp017 [Mamestra configurata nucleopolyhedrovirus B]AAM95004.1 hypothetical protein [Mamestra configurata nucleopolyhedrovirus B]
MVSMSDIYRHLSSAESRFEARHLHEQRLARVIATRHSVNYHIELALYNGSQKGAMGAVPRHQRSGHEKVWMLHSDGRSRRFAIDEPTEEEADIDAT